MYYFYTRRAYLLSYSTQYLSVDSRCWRTSSLPFTLQFKHVGFVMYLLSLCPQRKSLIATSLIVVVSLFVVVVNYAEKPYFLLQPVFGQTFSSHWMFSKQPYKAFKPHQGYVSIPKQEVSDTNIDTCTCQLSHTHKQKYFLKSPHVR